MAGTYAVGASCVKFKQNHHPIPFRTVVRFIQNPYATVKTTVTQPHMFQQLAPKVVRRVL